MIKTNLVKFIEFDDLTARLSVVLGMKFNNKGAWNCPKDCPSFNIDLPSSSEDCYSYRGEAKWLWAGYVNEAQNNWELKMRIDGLNTNHHHIRFYDCLIVLRNAGELEDDFYVISHSW
jgi:hypothetical protein